jgi:hypothetical protein
MLDVLLGAGFEPRDALLVKGAILRFAVGYLGLARMPSHIDAATVDPASYPRVHEVGDVSARLAEREFLEFGLDCIIAGIPTPRAVPRRGGSRRSAPVRRQRN